MADNQSKISSENPNMNAVNDSSDNQSWQQSGQSRTWKAPDLYLSHSEASLDQKESKVDAEVFDDFQHTELLTGLVLNKRYKILDVLGEGAMAVVYDALDMTTGQKVAAKTLKFTESSLVIRFSREIEIHQKLKHPNIVDALECVQGPNNLCLFMMEKVDGKDLEECLESLYRFDDLNHYSSVLSQLCDGLEHAHKKGIIHRDLKPENIILKLEDDAFRLKILDFGVAKIQEDLQKLTKTGLVIGSPAYMSPEQCIGNKLSEKSDIYSVGILAYELLTGELPYDATDPISMMKAHCSAQITPRPITDHREDTPAVKTLQGIINATLQYDPDLRYQNINQLKRDLDKWWHEAELGKPGQESPFKFVDESELAEEEKSPEPFKQDFSRLNELVDSQRQTQVDTLRENFKESALPKQAFDWKKLMPAAIAFGAIFVIGAVVFALSLVDWKSLNPQNDTKVESTKGSKKAESNQEAKETVPNKIEEVQKSPVKKKKKKKKRRKIIAPGWVQK